MFASNLPPVSVSAEYFWASAFVSNIFFNAFIIAFQSEKIANVYRCVRVCDPSDPDGKDLCGLCLPTGYISFTIYIATTTNGVSVTEDEQTKTLIHELLHAVIVRQIGFIEKEESITQNLEFALWHLFTPTQKEIIRQWLPGEVLDYQPLPIECCDAQSFPEEPPASDGSNAKP